METIVSKFIDRDGVERAAHLFKAPKQVNLPTLWVCTNSLDFNLRDSLTFKWDEGMKGLVWYDHTTEQITHDIAYGIIAACNYAGISVA